MSGPTNAPAATTNSPTAPDPAVVVRAAFLQGVRYGLLAATRNPDVHDARVLAGIAEALFAQEHAAPGPH